MISHTPALQTHTSAQDPVLLQLHTLRRALELRLLIGQRRVDWQVLLMMMWSRRGWGFLAWQQPCWQKDRKCSAVRDDWWDELWIFKVSVWLFYSSIYNHVSFSHDKVSRLRVSVFESVNDSVVTDPLTGWCSHIRLKPLLERGHGAS